MFWASNSFQLVFLWHCRREKSEPSLQPEKPFRVLAGHRFLPTVGEKPARETNDSTVDWAIAGGGILKHWLFRVQLQLEKLGTGGDERHDQNQDATKMQHFNDISQTDQTGTTELH